MLILNEHSAGFEDWNLDNLLLLNSNLLLAWMLLIWGGGGRNVQNPDFKKRKFPTFEILAIHLNFKRAVWGQKKRVW